LPTEFHSSNSFDHALTILENALGDSAIFESGKIDAPLLFLGLMFREVSRSMEMEPGAETKAPAQLVNSPFGIEEMNRMEILIDSISPPLIE
jgi:hypothetical protein